MVENIGSFSPVVLIFFILIFALKNKINIFNSFLNGASEGINCVVSILPVLVALVTAVEMLKASGLIGIITNLLSPMALFLKFPAECIPLIFMKPISGSGSNAILYSLLEKYGPESKIGEISSLISGSSEAIIYIISTYCGAAKIKESKKIIIYSILSFLSSIIFINFVI